MTFVCVIKFYVKRKSFCKEIHARTVIVMKSADRKTLTEDRISMTGGSCCQALVCPVWAKEIKTAAENIRKYRQQSEEVVPFSDDRMNREHVSRATLRRFFICCT
mgnify:CR=1 FL=1